MNSVPEMLEKIHANWRGSEAELERKLHHYYLLCCRAIWKLILQEDSRKGIEVAEKYLDGLASYKELCDIDYYVEAAAFNLDYNCDPGGIEKLVEEYLAIPSDELRGMIHPPDALDGVAPVEVLKRAAYFADFAVQFPDLTLNDPPQSYVPFLSPTLLKEVFDEILT
jgi:hypothetical protein